MARDNGETHTQSEDVLSKMLGMVGKKPGLPKSAIGWVAALAFLGYVRSQFLSMDEYIQKTAANSPAIIGYQKSVGDNFNDVAKELVILDYRLKQCEKLEDKVAGLEKTLAEIKFRR